MRVILMSGDVPADGVRPENDFAFLPKPFSVEVLGARLRDVLGDENGRTA